MRRIHPFLHVQITQLKKNWVQCPQNHQKNRSTSELESSCVFTVKVGSIHMDKDHHEVCLGGREIIDSNWMKGFERQHGSMRGEILQASQVA